MKTNEMILPGLNAIRSSFLCCTFIASTMYAAASPTTDAVSAPREQTISQRVGVQTFTRGTQMDPSELRETLKITKRMGMSSFRFDAPGWYFYDWDETANKPIPKQHGWELLRAQLEICQELGIKPIIIFPPMHEQIKETRFGDDTQGWPLSQSTLDVYKNWVTETILRINKEFPSMQFTAALGNEVGHNTLYWKHKDKFFELTKQTSIAIRKAGGKCKIALSSIGTNHTLVTSPVDYMKDAKAYGLFPHIDLVTLNNYPNSSADFQAPETLYFITQAIKKVLDGKSFSISEAGAHTFDSSMLSKVPNPEKAEYVFARQGAYLIRHILFALGMGAEDVTIFEALDRLRNGEGHNNSLGSEQSFGFMDRKRLMKMGGKELEAFLKTYGNHKIRSYGPTEENPRHFEAKLISPAGHEVTLGWAVAPYDVAPGYDIMPKPLAGKMSLDNSLLLSFDFRKRIHCTNLRSDRLQLAA